MSKTTFSILTRKRPDRKGMLRNKLESGFNYSQIGGSDKVTLSDKLLTEEKISQPDNLLNRVVFNNVCFEGKMIKY